MLLEGAVPLGQGVAAVLRKENTKQPPSIITQMKPSPLVTIYTVLRLVVLILFRPVCSRCPSC